MKNSVLFREDKFVFIYTFPKRQLIFFEAQCSYFLGNLGPGCT